MIFWQHDARKSSERLAKRLMKYRSGQILLRTKDDELRGQVRDFEETGPKLRFLLLWLAKKKIISTGRWNTVWKWELTHGPASLLSCSLTFEMERGTECGRKEEPGTSQPNISARASVEIKKFYQNKKRVMGGVVFPKCLFFTTTLGERGTLFQPHDPRNLRLLEDGVIIDPGCPPEPEPVK